MKFSINKKKQKDMKLRHLLLASFAACTFASCSDDSSNGIEIPEENYQMIDANVSLTATALDGIQTKGATKEGGDAVLESGSNNEQLKISLILRMCIQRQVLRKRMCRCSAR